VALALAVGSIASSRIVRAQTAEEEGVRGFHVGWSDANEPHRAAAERDLGDLHMQLREALTRRGEPDGMSRVFATDARLREIYDQLRAITELAPSLTIAWLDLADIDFEFRDANAMLEHLAHARTHAAGTPLIVQVLFQQGIAYTMLDRFADARDVYLRALEYPLSNSGRGLSLCNLAEIETYLHEADDSIAHYEACVSLLPGYPGGYWGLASALDREGREAEARAAASRAVSIDPDARSLSGHGVFYTPPYEEHYYLALAREAQGRRTEAALEWRRYLDAGGAHDPWAHRAEAHLRALTSPRPGTRPTGRERLRPVRGNAATH
jgi:tetratricopeptide (TPR) repeat protein